MGGIAAFRMPLRPACKLRILLPSCQMVTKLGGWQVKGKLHRRQPATPFWSGMNNSASPGSAQQQTPPVFC